MGFLVKFYLQLTIIINLNKKIIIPERKFSFLHWIFKTIKIFTSLFVLLSLVLIVNIDRWNCAVRAKKLQTLQEILWMTIITCLMISNIEFFQYLIFKTCWVNFLFLEKYKITPESVENTTGYSKLFFIFFSFKTPGRQHKLTKD